MRDRSAILLVKAPDSHASLADWLPWLESLSPREIVLGLERVHAVLERLDIARPELVISVAGTNGKGSSVAILESILRRQGFRTGSYTSPHIISYNERTRIDGQSASDDAVIAALQAVESVRGDIPLTFFEFGTLATLLAFDAAEVDTWLLEIGMGGRLDAVNAIEPDGSLITNIALDHCAWLGNDIDSIATEKAGIMRKNKPVVYASTAVPDAIRRVADDTGANLIVAGEDYSFDVHADRSWSWTGRRLRLAGLAPPSLPGDVQFGNAAGVLALLEALGRDELFDAHSLGVALGDIRLDGRFQCLGKRWVLDVAHNPAAAAVLAGQLQAHGGQGRLIAIVGMLADKDVAGFIEPLGEAVDRFIAVSIVGSRGSRAQSVAQSIANAINRPCQVIENIGAAMTAANAIAADGDRILVTGSFYIVGPALQWLERHREADFCSKSDH